MSGVVGEGEVISYHDNTFFFVRLIYLAAGKFATVVTPSTSLANSLTRYENCLRIIKSVQRNLFVLNVIKLFCKCFTA